MCIGGSSSAYSGTSTERQVATGVHVIEGAQLRSTAQAVVGVTFARSGVAGTARHTAPPLFTSALTPWEAVVCLIATL